MNVANPLTRLGGVSGRQELLRAHTRVEIERACTAGQVVRVDRGLYAVPVADPAAVAARKRSVGSSRT